MAGIDSGIGGLWIKKKFLITSSSSMIVHTAPITSFHSVDYITTAYNNVESKNKTLNIKAHNNYTNIKKSVYAKIGNMNISYVFSIVGGNMILTVTNGEAFDVSLEYARLTLGS